MLSMAMLNTITQTRISSDIVQDFIRQFGFGRKSTKKDKKERLSVLKINMQMQNLLFEDYFPNKRGLVVLKIVQLLHHCGVAKVKAETIAKKVNCSVSTVYNTIQTLKQTKQIFVGRGGGKGYYVFVDKLHANYKEAMSFIYGLDFLEAEIMRKDLIIGDISCYKLDEESRLKSLLEAVKRNQDESIMTEEEVNEIERDYLSNEEEKQPTSLIKQVAYQIEETVKKHYKNVLNTWTTNKELHTFYDVCQKYSSYEQTFNVMECLYTLLNECQYRFPTKNEVALAIQTYINLAQLFNSVSDRNTFSTVFKKALVRSFEIEGIYTNMFTATRKYKKLKTKNLKAHNHYEVWGFTEQPTAENYFNEANWSIDGYYEKYNKKPKVSDVISLVQFEKGKNSIKNTLY